ncbi:MAG TPA: hypothetical protein ENH65_16690 [Candidatus Aminicenantes bacterium]|nr:hypothetical protein [Candidatus Aminicenantes bacterium]HEB35921.1 hypothetical protein [Candidatus Aminicenantes bacterium]
MTRIKSPLHPNIVVPKGKFCDLGIEAQEIITAHAEIIVKKMGTGSEELEGDPVKATIELLEKGLLRIVHVEESGGIIFELFNFETGQYVQLRPQTEH